MKFVSWNVNGLRACLSKGFMEIFKNMDADFFCLQETKMQQGQAEVITDGYFQFWNSAEKKGYSGTAIFSKYLPLNVTYGIGVEAHLHEGRVITLEMESFYLVNCYTPNSKADLSRLDYRMVWENDFREYLKKLDEHKPVILCGDLNVAHNEIDLKNPQSNHKNAGFTDEERTQIESLFKAGFVDTFRLLYPEKRGAYSWWSYRFNARKNNAGWRIDYFVVSEEIKDKVVDSIIHNSVFGSDHCPVELDLEVI